MHPDRPAADPEQAASAVAQFTARIASAITAAHDEQDLAASIAALPLHEIGLQAARLDLHGEDTATSSGATANGATTNGHARSVVCRGSVAGTLSVAGGAMPGIAGPLLDTIAALAGAQLDTIRRLKESRALSEALQIDRVYFEELFAASPEAIVVLDGEDRVMRVNRAFEELFGYTSSEIQGRTINEVIVPEAEQAVARQLTHDVAAGRRIQAESVRRRKDGSLLHVSIMGAPVVVHGNQVAVYGIYRDITAQKEAEEALRRLSTTDELTGLYNRRGFFLLAEQQRRIAIRRKAELLLLYIDIDDFKRVNDTFGHTVGDRMLADLGAMMRSCFRDSDILARVGEDEGLLARMGGDEFVILAIDAGEHGDDILSRRLQERVASYNEHGGAPCPISLSIGTVRMVPENTQTIDELIAEADQLMYENKRDRE